MDSISIIQNIGTENYNELWHEGLGGFWNTKNKMVWGLEGFLD